MKKFYNLVARHICNTSVKKTQNISAVLLLYQLRLIKCCFFSKIFFFYDIGDTNLLRKGSVKN